MVLQRQLMTASVVLIGAGIAIAAPFAITPLQQHSTVVPAAITAEATPSGETVAAISQKEIIQGTPRTVRVPSLSIDVPVNDGFYDAATGQWTLSDTSAFYATPTSPVNSDSGNTLIYAHNSTELFGKLLTITPGSDVLVTTDNGYEFTYTYMSTEAVSPTDVSPLAYEGAPRLTLQTCSGLWNQNRQMFYFELKDYRNV